jgi:integrase
MATELQTIPPGLVDHPRRPFFDALASRRRNPPRLTIRQFVAYYATTRELRGETIRQYAIVAERFEEWAGGPVYLDELDELALSAFLREYAASGMRPATVRSKRCSLLALWRAAADEYLCEPPARRIRTARVPWVPPTAWTLAEVRQLLATAATLPRWHPCGLRRAEWWPLAIRLAWDTGLRWGDLIALRVDAIDGRMVIVPQSKTRRPQTGLLSASTLAALTASLERCPRAVAVPWEASHETFNAQVRRLVAKAGIRPGTWKWLRRAGACDVEIQNPGRGHAARHLGHAPGSKIAELHYIDPAVLWSGVQIVAPRDLDG